MSDIGWALRKMRDGTWVQRRSWKDEGKYIGLDHGINGAPSVIIVRKGQRKWRHVGMFSHDDLFATDWVIAK